VLALQLKPVLTLVVDDGEIVSRRPLQSPSHLSGSAARQVVQMVSFEWPVAVALVFLPPRWTFLRIEDREILVCLTMSKTDTRRSDDVRE